MQCYINVTGGGVDYNSGPYSVILPAGFIILPFSVMIYNDTILENDESFILTIDPSSTPDGVSDGQATVTIVDDDSECSLHIACFQIQNLHQ